MRRIDTSALPLLIAVALPGSAFSFGYPWNEDLGWYLASGDRILEWRPTYFFTDSREFWVWGVAVLMLAGAIGIWQARGDAAPARRHGVADGCTRRRSCALRRRSAEPL